MTRKRKVERIQTLMKHMPKRTKEFELSGDYEGWKFTAITSFPVKVISYMQSGNFALIAEALSQLLISWNFVDWDGNPLAQPSERYPVTDSSGDPIVTLPDVLNGQVVEGTGGKPVYTSAVFELPMELMNEIMVKISGDIGNVDVP